MFHCNKYKEDNDIKKNINHARSFIFFLQNSCVVATVFKCYSQGATSGSGLFFEEEMSFDEASDIPAFSSCDNDFHHVGFLFCFDRVGRFSKQQHRTFFPCKNRFQSRHFVRCCLVPVSSSSYIVFIDKNTT